ELSSSDKLLIHAFDIPNEAVAECARVAQSKGAQVAVRLESNVVRRQLMRGMTESNAKLHATVEKHEMDQMTAYLALRGSHNYAELSDVPSDIQSMWQRVYATPVVFE